MGQSIEQEIRKVIDSLDASNWLKQTLESALQRDYIDAANDAEYLSDLLNRRAAEKLGVHLDTAESY